MNLREILTHDIIDQKVLLHKYTKFETSMSINNFTNFHVGVLKKQSPGFFSKCLKLIKCSF